jgi:hypothetical protein
MRKTKFLLFTIVLGLTYLCSGCASGPPNPGFRVETFYTLNGSIFDDPYRGIDLEIFRSKGTTTGQYNKFLNKRTNGASYYDAYDGIAPADWYVYELDGDCAGLSTIDAFYPGQASDIYCNVTTSFAFFATPQYIDRNNPPYYVTVNGSGISTVGGMPKVQYLDQNGNLVDEVVAFEVALGGGWARGYTPSLSGSPDGLYTMRIMNPNGVIAGSATINVYTSEPEPEPDPYPCYYSPSYQGSDSPYMDRPLCY